MNPATHMAIGSCRDVAEAALVRAVLTAHEIPVHISGGNAASLGLGSSAVEQRIWVPRAQADEASALLAEMREGGEHALADGVVPADDTAEREEDVTDDGAVVAPIDGGPDDRGADTVSRLRRRDRVALAIAAGVVVGFGTAHMSARAWKRGFVLAAADVAGWWTLFARDARLGASIVVATILTDLVGAILILLRDEPPLPTAIARRPR